MKSVHLCNFPLLSENLIDTKLNTFMDLAKDICNAALSIRKDKGIRTRMPLSKITIYTTNQSNIISFVEIIKDEINVKEVVFNDNLSSIAHKKVSLNLKLCGAKLGKNLKSIIAKVNNKEYELMENGTLQVDNFTFNNQEYINLLELKKQDGVRICNQDTIIELDTQITQDLENQGITRDIVRMIQNARKSAKLNIADRITLQMFSDSPKISAALQNNANLEYIASQTLATTNSQVLSEPVANMLHEEIEQIGTVFYLIAKSSK